MIRWSDMAPAGRDRRRSGFPVRVAEALRLCLPGPGGTLPQRDQSVWERERIDDILVRPAPSEDLVRHRGAVLEALGFQPAADVDRRVDPVAASLYPKTMDTTIATAPARNANTRTTDAIRVHPLVLKPRTTARAMIPPGAAAPNA